MTIRYKNSRRRVVLRLMRTEGYNCAQDIADELGITIQQASSTLVAMSRQGVIRATDRELPNDDGYGRRLRVFEVIT